MTASIPAFERLQPNSIPLEYHPRTHEPPNTTHFSIFKWVLRRSMSFTRSHVVFASKDALGVDFPAPRWSSRTILYLSGLKYFRSLGEVPPPGPPIQFQMVYTNINRKCLQLELAITVPCRKMTRYALNKLVLEEIWAYQDSHPCFHWLHN